ncbi:protein phosphatase regulator, partial [Cryomyces antarcticus]
PPHRQTSKSKLQKTPPDIKIPPRDRAADVASDAMSPILQSPVVEKQSAAIAAVATMEGQDAGVSAPQRAPPMKPALRLRSPTEPQHVVTNLERLEGQSRKEHNGPLSPLTNMLRSDREPRPEKVKKAKQRVQLDDFDSPQDGDKSADPFADPNEVYDSLYQDNESHAPAAKERLSESPVEILSPVSPLTEAEANSIPALVRDTSSHSDQDDELVSPSSTPSLLEADAASAATTTTTTTAPTTPHATAEPQHTAQSPLHSTRIEPPTHSSPRPSSSSPTSLRTPLRLTPTPTWSDTRLRAFLDGDNDIREMLLLVHDRSGAVPVGADHPLAKGLFGAERERLAEMEGVLDRLLEGVLGRGRGR